MTNGKLYLDGQELGFYYAHGGGDYTDFSGGTLDIGASKKDGFKYESFFEGQIDELRFYNRALTEKEIQQQYLKDKFSNPLFADIANNDFHLKSEKGRFYPEEPANTGMFGDSEGLWSMDLVTSPCIDLGDPAVNPSSETTPNGGRINAGAYGGTPYASKSEYPLRGDINRDGTTNLVDLAELSRDWLLSMPWY